MCGCGCVGVGDSVGGELQLTFFVVVFRNLLFLVFFNGGVTGMYKQHVHTMG